MALSLVDVVPLNHFCNALIQQSKYSAKISRVLRLSNAQAVGRCQRESRARAHGRPRLSLKHRKSQVDQKPCQPCLFGLNIMLMCVSPISSVSSQVGVTDDDFLRQKVLELIVRGLRQRAATRHLHPSWNKASATVVWQSGAGTRWNKRPKLLVKLLAQSKKPIADQNLKAQQSMQM